VSHVGFFSDSWYRVKQRNSKADARNMPAALPGLIGCTVFWTIAGAGLAQTAAVTHGDWQAACETEGSPCVLSQSVMAADRSWLATVLLQPSGDGARVQLMVPAGVHLASGIFIETAQPEAQPARWLVCTPEACRAELDLDAEGLAAWKQGRSAEVRYRSRIDGPVVAFDVSLMGMTAALEDVRGKP
jgi:invasion protein IalB